MPLYRIELHRRVLQPGEHSRNPFLGGMPSDNKMVTMSVRAWEFEAKDVAEVHAILQAARDADLASVRGYSLRSILLADLCPEFNRLPYTKSSDQPGKHFWAHDWNSDPPSIRCRKCGVFAPATSDAQEPTAR